MMIKSLQNTAPDKNYFFANKKDHHPDGVRFFAYLFSYFFHPLFISLYATYYLVFIHPGYFNGINEQGKIWILLRVAVNMIFFPLISVLLLKGVGFIDSIFLKTQRESYRCRDLAIEFGLYRLRYLKDAIQNFLDLEHDIQQHRLPI